MPTHAQAPAIVEENDACNAVRTCGLAEQCAHYCFGGTWFSDESSPESFVILLKQETTLVQVASAEVWATFDDGSSWFAASV
jgi:hypothetical protein